MKNFEKFITLIDTEEYQTVMNAANQSMKVSNRFEVSDNAFFVALELLKRYHNWIHQND